MSIAEKLQTVAENQQRVYDAGYAAGQSAGGGDTEAERKAFWDAFQNQGKRTDYTYAFSRGKWLKESLRPIYDFKPTGEGAKNMFYFCPLYSNELFSMEDVERDCGIVFDFSACTTLSSTFNNCPFSVLNVIDVRNATAANALYQAFYNGSGGSLKRINRLIFSENTKIGWGVFGYCSSLTYVGFEGTIAASIDVHWSPLDKESLQSLMVALSSTASGFTATISQSAVDIAFETSKGAKDGGTSEEWRALVDARPNWTITLS